MLTTSVWYVLFIMSYGSNGETSVNRLTSYSTQAACQRNMDEQSQHVGEWILNNKAGPKTISFCLPEDRPDDAETSAYKTKTAEMRAAMEAALEAKINTISKKKVYAPR